ALPAEESVRGDSGDGEEQHVTDAAIGRKELERLAEEVRRGTRDVEEAPVRGHAGEDVRKPLRRLPQLFDGRLRPLGDRSMRLGIRGGRLEPLENHRTVEKERNDEQEQDRNDPRQEAPFVWCSRLSLGLVHPALPPRLVLSVCAAVRCRALPRTAGSARCTAAHSCPPSHAAANRLPPCPVRCGTTFSKRRPAVY